MNYIRRTYTTTLSIKECHRIIRENLELIFFNYGSDRFEGWVRLGFIRIIFTNSLFRLQKPIFNRVTGRIRSKGGITRVFVHTYQGLTDIISLLKIFLFSSMVILIIFNSPILNLLIVSIIISLFLSFLSFLMTVLSENGKSNEFELIDFLERSLDLKLLE